MRKFRIITNIISIILILGYIIYLVFKWQTLPDTIPVHFNSAGEIDGYGSKTYMIIEPIIMVVLFIIISITERFPRFWNMPVKITPENRDRQYKIACALLGFMKVMCIIIFIVAGVASINPGVPAMLIMVIVGIMLIVTTIMLLLSFKYR